MECGRGGSNPASTTHKLWKRALMSLNVSNLICKVGLIIATSQDSSGCQGLKKCMQSAFSLVPGIEEMVVNEGYDYN